MAQIELKVTNREILGKKVRFLRRQGITPVHLFGHGIESVTLQCDAARLHRALAEAGKTRLINLKLDNEKSPRNVMVREVQIEPRTGELLHVDFYQVRMAEEVRVEVPVVLVGEAPVLTLKENMLVQELNTLTISCLPAKMPTSVEVNLGSLTEAEQTVRVKDIKLGEEIIVLNDPEHIVVRISLRLKEKIKEPVAEMVETPEAASVPAEASKEE